MTEGAPMVENRISRGNIFSMVTTIIGVVTVIVTVSLAFNNVDRDTQANTADIATLKNTLGQVQNSVRVLEISEARTAERFNSILTNVDEIKTELRQQGELLRAIGRN